jgi:hypothetical protein
MSILSILSGLFSSSKVTDTAIDVVRKITNVDEMSDKEKAQFVLDYMSATKHQSPMRRLIAAVTVFGWALLILSWLVFSGIGWMMDIDGAVNFAGSIYSFFKDVIAMPYSLILSFYFANGMINSLKK